MYTKNKDPIKPNSRKKAKTSLEVEFRRDGNDSIPETPLEPTLSQEMDVEPVDESEEQSTNMAVEELTYSSLTRDRERREIRPPQRYGQADCITYAFNLVDELSEEESRTFEEFINIHESKY